MATIAENLTLLQSTKANIKQAIINKGVSVSDTDTFASYADKIGLISGGGGDIDFSQLGYAYTPTILKDGFDASVAYMNNWTPNHFNGDNSVMFMPKVEISESEDIYLPPISNFPSLLIFPDIDFKHKNIKGSLLFLGSVALSVHLKNINITSSMRNMFSNCAGLSDLTFDGITIDSNVTDASYCFYSCPKLPSVPDIFGTAQTNLNNFNNAFAYCNFTDEIDLSGWKVGQVTDMSNMFMSNSKLVTIDITGWDTSLMNDTTKLSNMCTGCSNLVRIRGIIDVIGMNSLIPSIAYSLSNFTTITFKNLGCHKGNYALFVNTGAYSKWGLGDEESKQSFVHSMTTLLYDRAANSLPAIEIHMNSGQRALLNDADIATILAKGYTIAS